MFRLIGCGVLAMGLAWPLEASRGEPGRYFKIHVVDEQTGRGVPLVELRTVYHTRYVTDSNGLVAFYEPGLMGQKVFFEVRSHGYEFRKDGFGFAGVALEVREGQSATIRLTRRNLAERLYRITGVGIYHDSLLLGQPVPLARPVVNGLVAGQDSVMAVAWRDKLWWFWGDTNRPGYPLGLFRVSGATSKLPSRGGLDPSRGVDLEYFVDSSGFSRAMCPMEGSGPGPVWIEGLLVVPDPTGKDRLLARYTRMKTLGEILEHGLVVFDEKQRVFRKHVEFELKEKWRFPHGHPVLVQDGDRPVTASVGAETGDPIGHGQQRHVVGCAAGSLDTEPANPKLPGDLHSRRWFLFGRPFPVVRVPARWECLSDARAYEAFSCLERGKRYEKRGSRVERDGAGRLVYAWKPDTDPVGPTEEQELLQAGVIRPDEARFLPRDLDTRKPVHLHSGSVRWNAFRQKWIMIAVQTGGDSSFLGEVWFSEADSPTGPWLWAKKIVTHDKYTFYNPVHHPFFDQQGGRIIYFEGTYASTFSGNPDPTPRYDYNQIMYRLDLADPRLPRPLAPAGR